MLQIVLAVAAEAYYVNGKDNWEILLSGQACNVL